MRGFVQPIENIINTIREHKVAASSEYLSLDHDTALRHLRDPDTGVVITPVTAK